MPTDLQEIHTATVRASQVFDSTVTQLVDYADSGLDFGSHPPRPIFSQDDLTLACSASELGGVMSNTALRYFSFRGVPAANIGKLMPGFALTPYAQKKT